MFNYKTLISNPDHSELKYAHAQMGFEVVGIKKAIYLLRGHMVYLCSVILASKYYYSF